MIKEWYSVAAFTSSAEDVTKNKYAYIWAYSFYSPYTGQLVTDRGIDSFMRFVLLKRRNCVAFYVRDLQRVGTFVVDWLERNKWRQLEKKSNKRGYIASIGEGGEWYSIKINIKVEGRARYAMLYNTEKKIELKPEEVKRGYTHAVPLVDVEKKYRSREYEMNENERRAVQAISINDGNVLNEMLKLGLTHVSNAIDAWVDYVGYYGRANIRALYPQLTDDANEFTRAAFYSGFCYVEKEKQGKDIGAGMAFDVNSMYAKEMKCKPMPYGVPTWHKGAYKPRAGTVQILHIAVIMELKKNKLPTVTTSNNLFFPTTEYITTTRGERIELWLTDVDYNLMIDAYDVICVDHYDQLIYEAQIGLFDEYVDKWYNLKQSSEKGSVERMIAKKMLVCLYGYFAKQTKKRYIKPSFNPQDAKINYDNYIEEEKETIYIATSVFIAAYARSIIIPIAQKTHQDGIFLYSDTDSIYIEGDRVPEYITLDNSALGSFKLEDKFTRARFLKEKIYGYENERGETVIKMAGVPYDAKRVMTLDDLHFGKVMCVDTNKKICAGGCYYEPVEYIIEL